MRPVDCEPDFFSRKLRGLCAGASPRSKPGRQSGNCYIGAKPTWPVTVETFARSGSIRWGETRTRWAVVGNPAAFAPVQEPLIGYGAE